MPTYESDDPPQGHCRSPQDLNLSDLQRLILMLGRYADPNGKPERPGHPVVDSIVESWPITSIAAEVIYRWPKGFGHVLHWLRTTNDDGETTHRFGLDFGRLYNQIYAFFRTPQFDFIRHALENYLVETWPGVTVRRGARLSGIDHVRWKWVPASRACSRLGVSRRTLSDLIARGDLEGDARVTEHGRTRVYVRGASLKQLEGQPKLENVDLVKAAHELGLKKSRLRRLVTKLFPTAWQSSGSTWQIPRAELDRLRVVEEQIQDTHIIGSHEITVGNALRYLSLSDDALLHLVREVRSPDGRWPNAYSLKLRGIASWVYDREYLEQLNLAFDQRAAKVLHEGITLPKLAIRWGIKQEVVYQLERAGAFKGLKVNHCVYRGQIVPMAEVERFERTYVPARDLAEQLNMSPRNTIVILEISGFEPAFGPRSKGCRQTFFRRSDRLTTFLEEYVRRGLPRFNVNHMLGLGSCRLIPMENCHEDH
jgi:hypothetical protein